MNIIERNISAYIVEALTGVRGEGQERVYEVLAESTAKPKDPLMRLVLETARPDPEATETKEMVAALVAGYIITERPEIAEYFEMLGDEKEEDSEPEISLVRTSASGVTAFALCADNRPLCTFTLPSKYADEVVKKFSDKFPGAKIVDVDNN